MNLKHQQSLGYLTGLASRLFNKQLTTRFKAIGIDMTAEQWGVIVVLHNNDPLTQGQIGELLYLEKSSVSRSIAGLEKRGWIERCACPNDSRKKMVRLTEKLMDVSEQCFAVAQSVLDDVHREIHVQELQVAAKTLNTAINVLRSQLS